MRGKSIAASLAATAALAAGLSEASVSASGQVTVQQGGDQAQTQPADRNKSTQRNKVEKSHRSGGLPRMATRPRSKPYSASVKQHQRHAAKKRNQARARKANR